VYRMALAFVLTKFVHLS
ncbi:DEAD/DEAH box helicase family protein, partial [Vibrio parahaemolyticus V-223/04]